MSTVAEMPETANARETLSAAARRIAREEARASNATCPVEVIPGDSAPREVGKAAYYTTAGGKPVYHPNAYRRAWGKCVRHCSTIRVEVGEEWISEHVGQATAAELARVRGPRECLAAMDRVGPAEHAEWYTEEARLRRERDRLLPADAHRHADSAWDRAKARIAAVCDPREHSWLGAEELHHQACLAAQWLAYAPAADAYTAHLANQPADDRRRIERPYLVAKSRDGLVIADRREDPREVQVVVRDATTGQRHCIPVPPVFGRVGSGHWRRLRTDAARVRAAVAWTFALPAEEYRPAVEA